MTTDYAPVAAPEGHPFLATQTSPELRGTVRDAHPQAGILLAELLDCLRRSLWKGRILAGRFELEEQVKAEIPTPRTRWNEYHLATIETVWNYVWPSRGLEELTKMERP